MTCTSCYLATALLLVATAPVVGQEAVFAVKKCDEPKVPIGTLPAAGGTVHYRLGPDGRPDTASVGVTQVTGLSVAGFRSVVVRQLHSCRFEVSKSRPELPVGVVQSFTTKGSTISFGSATGMSQLPAVLDPAAPPLPLDSFPLQPDDARLEERPRRITCSNPLPARPLPRAEMEQWFRDNMGTIMAEVRVNADGKPDRRVRVISSDNASATKSLVNLLLNCKFVPGRYFGVPVPGLTMERMGIVGGPPPS